MASKDDSSAKDQSSPVDNSTKKSTDQNSEDPELDAILDSALADFDKQAEQTSAKLATLQPAGATGGDSKGSSDASASSSKDKADQESDNPEDLNYDLLSDLMTKQFEDTFTALMNDPNMKQQLEEFATSAEDAASENNPTAFADTVERALNSLNLNAENIQGDPNQQELWEQLAETLGVDKGGSLPGGAGLPSAGVGGGAGLDAMGGLFQNMVKQLLSKELLYQPLQEVSVKYKEYLETNESTLEPEKLDVYRKQLAIVDKVVEHLDGESEDHTLVEKNARFEVLLDLLQRMHDLGQPPVEVVGEGNPMMPNFPGMPDLAQFANLGEGQDPNCSVM